LVSRAERVGYKARRGDHCLVRIEGLMSSY
jgi:hypothetical protein